MRLTRIVSITLLSVGVAGLVCQGNAQSISIDDQIKVARSTLNADRKATLAETMQFTENEGQAFWPLYEKYRAEMAKQGDDLLKLIKEYAQLYPNVPDARAKVMLKELGDLQKLRVETRISYLKKIEKVVSPAKALRFAQVESRLDLALQLELAANIPLVPIEGRLSGDAASASAVVAAGDAGQHKATLQFEDGTTRTVAVRPDVDLGKRQVGDTVVIRITEALAIQVAKP